MNILYSFNKFGFEGGYWTSEIARASTDDFKFIPFNHGLYYPPKFYLRAQALDEHYYERDPRLLGLYKAFEASVVEHKIDAVIVDNGAPYHPDYLRRMPIYKVLRTSDGPMSAYDRDFAYLHAYDHVLYHSPAYSRDMTMGEKLDYCGHRNHDFWPHGHFDALHDVNKTEDDVFAQERDIDIVFIGRLYFSKMPLLAKLKKVFGARFHLRGMAGWKFNLYFNAKYAAPGWVHPVPPGQHPLVYGRSKIGVNIHNRGDYTVGSYRLFDLPANGVMQISDGGPYLDHFFKPGEEIVGYTSDDDLIDKIRYYLSNDEERLRIARNGYHAAMTRHRIAQRLNQAGQLIRAGMDKIHWKGDGSHMVARQPLVLGARS